MTPAAYAKSRGLDKSTISRQIKAGQIPVLPPLPGKKRALIDPAVADQARARNIDPAKSSKTFSRPEAPAPLPVPAAPPPADETPVKREAAATPVKAAGDGDYTRARTESVTLEAQHRRLKLLQATGDLVAKGEVEEAAQKAARMLRDRILAAGEDLAELIRDAENMNVARVVMREGLRRALEGLAEDMRDEAGAIDDARQQ